MGVKSLESSANEKVRQMSGRGGVLSDPIRMSKLMESMELINSED